MSVVENKVSYLNNMVIRCDKEIETLQQENKILQKENKELNEKVQKLKQQFSDLIRVSTDNQHTIAELIKIVKENKDDIDNIRNSI